MRLIISASWAPVGEELNDGKGRRRILEDGVEGGAVEVHGGVRGIRAVAKGSEDRAAGSGGSSRDRQEEEESDGDEDKGNRGEHRKL